MNDRAGLLSAAIAIACTLAACSRGEQRACKPPRDYWQKPHNFVGLMPALNKVSVTHDGNIYWNGERISEQQLTEYLEISHSLNPEPDVFLETEMGVSCRALEKVRDQMDKGLECKKPYSSCAEGIETIWRDLPSPPGAPVS